MSVLKRDDEVLLHVAPSEQSAQGPVPKPGEPVFPQGPKGVNPPPEVGSGPPAKPTGKLELKPALVKKG
jgi:hypothetical protein